MSIAHESASEYETISHPRYDLSEQELRLLTQKLIEEKEPQSDARIVCYSLDTADPFANVARTLECEIFEQYFGNDAQKMKEEYGPYESQSRFFLSVDTETMQPAGVLRVIENGPSGLKTLIDLEAMSELGDPTLPSISQTEIQRYHDVESFDDCWDVGTVAVRKPYRTGNDISTSVQLYRALYVSAMENGIDHFVSIIDSRPLEKMVGYLGIPFVPMIDSKPFSYLGSESSQAVYGHVTEFYEKMNRGRWTSVKRLMARKAFNQLVKGSQDKALQL